MSKESEYLEPLISEALAQRDKTEAIKALENFEGEVGESAVVGVAAALGTNDQKKRYRESARILLVKFGTAWERDKKHSKWANFVPNAISGVAANFAFVALTALIIFGLIQLDAFSWKEFFKAE